MDVKHLFKDRKWKKNKLTGKELGKYHLDKMIASGDCSCIYLTTNTEGSPRVCKAVDEDFSEILKREFSILKTLKHPSIISPYDLVQHKGISAIILDFIENGDLHDNIIQAWPFEPRLRWRFSHQLVSAVEYIHSKDIAHCDIKLENILVDSTQQIRLVDFGSAMTASEATWDHLENIATTPEYLPPELLCKRVTTIAGYDVRMIDVWSVGVVLFLLLTGRFPFGEVEGNKVRKFIERISKIAGLEMREGERLLAMCETGNTELLCRMLETDPKKRVSMEEALQMEYFETSE